MRGRDADSPESIRVFGNKPGFFPCCLGLPFWDIMKVVSFLMTGGNIGNSADSRIGKGIAPQEPG
jgi:hypothetical protein